MTPAQWQLLGAAYWQAAQDDDAKVGAYWRVQASYAYYHARRLMGVE